MGLGVGRYRCQGLRPRMPYCNTRPKLCGRILNIPHVTHVLRRKTLGLAKRGLISLNRELKILNRFKKNRRSRSSTYSTSICNQIPAKTKFID